MLLNMIEILTKVIVLAPGLFYFIFGCNYDVSRETISSYTTVSDGLIEFLNSTYFLISLVSQVIILTCLLLSSLHDGSVLLKSVIYLILIVS